MFPKTNRYGALLVTSLLLLTGCSTKQSSIDNVAQASSLTGNSHTGTWVVHLEFKDVSIYLPPDGEKAYVMDGAPASQSEVVEFPITKVSEDWSLPPETKVISLMEPLSESSIMERQSEAETYVGSMNRAQQAFFLEQGKFSSELDELGLGIRSETDNYSYSVTVSTPSHVVSIAQSKKAALKSYLGVTYLYKTEQGEITTRALVCKSPNPGTSVKGIVKGLFPTENAACPSSLIESM